MLSGIARATLVIASAAMVACTAASSPMLAWSQDSCLDSFNAESFPSIIASSHSQDRVSLVFVQEDATVQDLTVFAQQSDTTPFMQAAHSSAASSHFSVDAFRTSSSRLLTDLADSESTVVVTAQGLSAASVEGKSVILVTMPSSHECGMAKTDSLIAAAVNIVDKATDKPLAVFYIATQQEAEQAPSRTRRSTVQRGPATNVAQQRLSLLPEPSYVAGRIEQRHEVALQWFSIPILSGWIVGLLFIFTIVVGSCGLMATKTPEQWPDPAHDKNLEVPQ